MEEEEASSFILSLPPSEGSEEKLFTHTHTERERERVLLQDDEEEEVDIICI